MKQFAIIGCGEIAKKHAENIVRIGRLKAVCDIEAGKTDYFSSKFNATPYETVDDLLAFEKEVDTIVVCTPNGYHAEHIIKSLQSGKDLLVESPLCLTKAAAWQIIETEKYCRKRLFIVTPIRYTPLLEALKEALEAQKFGKLYAFHLSCVINEQDSFSASWKGKAFPGGGILYSHFSSYIDSIIWLFGEVTGVQGFGTKSNGENATEVDDIGTVSLLMRNGMLGSIMWSVNAKNDVHQTELTIIAENGTIRLGGENLTEIKSLETKTHFSLSPSKDKETDSVKAVYDHFATVSDNDDTSFPNTFEGLKLVETLEKIYKATS